jgi:hypothetical protein
MIDTTFLRLNYDKTFPQIHIAVSWKKDLSYKEVSVKSSNKKILHWQNF